MPPSCLILQTTGISTRLHGPVLCVRFLQPSPRWAPSLVTPAHTFWRDTSTDMITAATSWVLTRTRCLRKQHNLQRGNWDTCLGSHRKLVGEVRLQPAFPWPHRIPHPHCPSHSSHQEMVLIRWAQPHQHITCFDSGSTTRDFLP